MVAEMEYSRQGGVETDPFSYSSLDVLSLCEPPRKYCDLTLLPAKYTDPTNQLRFRESDAELLILHLPRGTKDLLRKLRENVATKFN